MIKLGNIQLLDCTLRDGGFVNDWMFGADVITNIIRGLEDSRTEIIELGFLKNEPYSPERVVFNATEQIKKVVGGKKPGVLYAAMGELMNPLALDKLAPAEKDGLDIIRMMLWKTKRMPDGQVVDMLDEGFRYCKGLVEKGYRLCIQPVRTNQYSDDEFSGMVRRFSELEPMAIYVVDSWGTQNPENILHYMEIADQIVPEKTALGFHGHNSMMQALSITQAVLGAGFSHDLIVDASVYGIGRSAGNLHTELIAKYLNEEYGKKYRVLPILKIYEDYISKIREREAWGYSIPYLLAATHKCNPAYAKYLSGQKKLGVEAMEYVLTHLSAESKIIFSKQDADDCLEEYRRRER